MRRIIGLFLFGAMMYVPVNAQDRDHDRDNRDSHAQRYYDADHHDYHEWNEREQKEYDRYLSEHHRDRRDWNKANKREQKDYWKWRHDHSDTR